MKNDEIVEVTNTADISRLMCERRLSFITALMDECRLLQQRIEQEKLAMASEFSEFVWEESHQPSPLASVAALAELNAALDNLSKIDHILNDVAAQIGADVLAYGRML